MSRSHFSFSGCYIEGFGTVDYRVIFGDKKVHFKVHFMCIFRSIFLFFVIFIIKEINWLALLEVVDFQLTFK